MAIATPSENIKSIYTASNPWGYRYNVNHPVINELYLRFKKWKGLPLSSPLSNEMRAEFEKYVDGAFASNNVL